MSRSFELPPNAARLSARAREEIAAHLEERTAELMAGGIDAQRARAQALAEFGDVAEGQREIAGVDRVAFERRRLRDTLLDVVADAARVARSLLRRPGFTAAIIVTLALGVGANAAMFSLVDGLLLSAPPGLRAPDAVHVLGFNEEQRESGRLTWNRAPWRAFAALSEPGTGAQAMAAVTELRLGNPPLTVAAASPSYFRLLGVSPQLGNLSLDHPGAAVISHGLWATRYARSVSVLDSTIALGGQRYAIAGVAPRGFGGHRLQATHAWIPLSPETPGLPSSFTTMFMRSVEVLVRVPPEAAAATQATLTNRYRAAMAPSANADTSARVVLLGLIPGRNASGEPTREARVALWLQGVSLLALIIALANIGNMMLSRAIDRRGERALHLALGISRARLVRQSLTESALLAAAGGTASLAVVSLAGPLLWTMVLPADVDLSGLVKQSTGMTVLLSVAAAALMTALPLLVAEAPSPGELLREGGRGLTRRSSAGQSALVVVQLALTTVLLVGAGLFLRSMLKLSALDLGFDARRIAVMHIAPAPDASDSSARTTGVAAALSRIAVLPGVRAVAAGQSTPWRASLFTNVFLPGHATLPGVQEGAWGYPTYFAVTPGFFETMGLSLLQGRDFTPADDAGAPRVMLVDRAMAETFWTRESALGQCVRLGADTMPCTTVIGVVENSRRIIAGDTPHSLRYYLPLTQAIAPVRDRYIFVATDRPDAALEPLRAVAAATFSPETPIDVMPMISLLDPQLRPWRLGTRAFAGLAALSAVIALVGLYAATAFAAARRRREMAIRLALGSTPGGVIGLIVRQVLGRCILAMVLAGVAVFALGKRFGGVLFDTSPRDPAVLSVVVMMVLMAALIAGWLPARRAARVSPRATLA